MARPRGAQAPASPVAYRPSTDEKLLVELVAKHQGKTVSKLVKQVMADYLHAYVDEVGLDDLVAEVQQAEQQRETLMTHNIDVLRTHVALAASASARDTSSPATPPAQAN
jgi:Tat protein secretion system quality control protein TatD with DNase activity